MGFRNDGPMTLPVNTDWERYYVNADESEKYYYATGGMQYNVNGTVTAYPPSTPPEGYDWARDVTFSAPAGAVEGWIVDAYGSADAVPCAYAVSEQVQSAFGVDEVPTAWRCGSGMASGTPLQLFVLIDDADPATVRLRLRRMAD